MEKNLNWKNIKNEMDELFKNVVEIESNNSINDYIKFYNTMRNLRDHGFISRELFNKIYEYDNKLFTENF